MLSSSATVAYREGERKGGCDALNDRGSAEGKGCPRSVGGGKRQEEEKQTKETDQNLSTAE